LSLVQLIVRELPLQDSRGFLPRRNGSEARSKIPMPPPPASDDPGNIPPSSWELNYFSRPTHKPQIEQLDTDEVCTAKGTVIGVALAMVFLHVGMFGGFAFFYRSRRREWRKAEEAESVYGNGGSRDILFRSIYDQPHPFNAVNRTNPLARLKDALDA
ncbi:unnamed protein product, partial [Darwinula stevensoni]